LANHTSAFEESINPYTENCQDQKLKSSASMRVDMIGHDLPEPLQTSRLLWYEHTGCFLKHKRKRERNSEKKMSFETNSTKRERERERSVSSTCWSRM
jgi:hypothetical protein